MKIFCCVDGDYLYGATENQMGISPELWRRLLPDLKYFDIIEADVPEHIGLSLVTCGLVGEEYTYPHDAYKLMSDNATSVERIGGTFYN